MCPVRIAVLMVVTKMAETVRMIAITATISNNEKPRLRKVELLPTFTRPSVSLSTLSAKIATVAFHAQRFSHAGRGIKRENR
jgi:hypothetical protein